jgi:ArsR family metal-binding transcriptional regulator
LQVKDDDDVDIIAKTFGVDSFPAIIGVYQNGESKVLADGTVLNEAIPSVDELKTLLEEFEKKSKAAGPKKSKANEPVDVVSLTRNNMRKVCGKETALCIIGAYKSLKGMEKVKQILKEVSYSTFLCLSYICFCFFSGVFCS